MIGAEVPSAPLPRRVQVDPDLRDGRIACAIRDGGTLLFDGSLAGAIRVLATGDYHPARTGSPSVWERRS